MSYEQHWTRNFLLVLLPSCRNYRKIFHTFLQYIPPLDKKNLTFENISSTEIYFLFSFCFCKAEFFSPVVAILLYLFGRWLNCIRKDLIMSNNPARKRPVPWYSGDFMEALFRSTDPVTGSTRNRQKSSSWVVNVPFYFKDYREIERKKSVKLNAKLY